jgi:hypothetical protein
LTSVVIDSRYHLSRPFRLLYFVSLYLLVRFTYPIPAPDNMAPIAVTPPNGNESHPATYTIREEPFLTRKKLRVGFIGAGVSGLQFFKYAEEKLENVDIVCWEKNRDIGGTVRVPSKALDRHPLT